MFAHCYILVFTVVFITINGAQGKFHSFQSSRYQNFYQDIRCMFVYTIKVICELPLIEETSKAIPKERQVMDHGAGNMVGVLEKRQELTSRKGMNF